MPISIPSFTQALSDLRTLTQLQANLKFLHDGTDTTFVSLIIHKMLSLMLMSTASSEDLQSEHLSRLKSFAMLRVDLASLKYSLDEIDELMAMQLKAVERPSISFIADHTPLTVVSQVLTNPEAETYGGSGMR